MKIPRAIAIAFVLGLGFAAALTGIWDTDFFHHLAVGRAIANGADFSQDPFVFTLQGARGSVPPYWLGSLFLYGANVLGGLPGPVLLVGLVNVALCAILLADALDERGSWRDLGVAAAAILLTLPELRVRSAPRPEAFGLLLIAFTLLAIRRFERGRPRLLLAFPAVALLWSQLHVTVAIGLGLVGLLVAWRVTLAAASGMGWSWGAGARLVEARTPVLVLLASTLAAAINPSDTSPLRLALSFLTSLLSAGSGMGSGEIAGVVDVLRGVVEELHAPALADWSRPFGVLVVAALASFSLHRSRSWGRELASVVVFAAFAATSFRFATMASVVAAPIAARNLMGWLDRINAPRPRLHWFAAGAAILLGVARAVTSPTLPLQPVSVALESPTFPVSAAAYLKAIGFDGRLYNAFGAGGYLEWILDRPVFQDGRGLARAADMRDLFPEPIDRPRVESLDSRWRFDALVLSTRPPAAGSPGLAERLAATWENAADPATWSLVAVDEGAALYLRRQGRWAPFAARDEYGFLKPGLSFAIELLSNPTGARQLVGELERSVAASPACTRCRTNLAGALLQTGRASEAAAHLEVLDRSGSAAARPTIDFLLAMRAQLTGDAAGAERHWRDAIRRSQDPGPLRSALATVLLGAGRDADAAALIEQNLDSRRTSDDLGMAAFLARRAGHAERAGALEAEASRAARQENAVRRSQDGHRAMDRGRVAEARAAFVEASTLDPTLADPLVGLGWLELRTTHPDVAADVFERALRLAPQDPDAWHGLGLASETLGNKGRAAEAFSASLRARPSGALANEARSRLRALSSP